MMKIRIVIKVKMYQAMIKAPLTFHRRITEHYKWRDHFARKKIKTTQNEGPEPNDEKDQARLVFWPNFLCRSPMTREAPTYQI